MQYHGDEDMRGRPLARFEFRVPQAASRFQLQANGASAMVGMAGSFWVDTASLELARIEVQADEVPGALGIARTAAIVDYARMRFGASTVLLPQAAELLLALLSGEVRRNEIQFSHCRAYVTESSTRFDMPDMPPSAPAQAVRKVDLPADLTVPIALETAIDSATAHVGDLLRGHVVKDVRRKGKIVIPKGAIVTHGIRGLDRLRSERAFDLTIDSRESEYSPRHQCGRRSHARAFPAGHAGRAPAAAPGYRHSPPEGNALPHRSRISDDVAEFRNRPGRDRSSPPIFQPKIKI